MVNWMEPQSVMCGGSKCAGSIDFRIFYVRSLAVMMSPKLPRTIVFPLLIKLRHPLCYNLQELPIILANLALTAGDFVVAGVLQLCLLKAQLLVRRSSGYSMGDPEWITKVYSKQWWKVFSTFTQVLYISTHLRYFTSVFLYYSTTFQRGKHCTFQSSSTIEAVSTRGAEVTFGHNENEGSSCALSPAKRAHVNLKPIQSYRLKN